MTYAVLAPTAEERLQAAKVAKTILTGLRSHPFPVSDMIGVFTAFCQLCIDGGMTRPDQIDDLCSQFLTRTQIGPAKGVAT